MASTVTHPDARAGAREAVAEVAEGSYGTLVAMLSARTRDASGAEDAVADAFVAALALWPARGIPERPEAWLSAVAWRKWIDATRRRRGAERARGHLRLLCAEAAQAAADEIDPEHRLSPLTFVCGHPALEPAIRAPLLLQALVGFEAAEVARLLRVPPSAMSQRLVRAKRRLRAAGPAFEAPGRADLSARRRAVAAEIRAALAREGAETGAA